MRSTCLQCQSWQHFANEKVWTFSFAILASFPQHSHVNLCCHSYKSHSSVCCSCCLCTHECIAKSLLLSSVMWVESAPGKLWVCLTRWSAWHDNPLQFAVEYIPKYSVDMFVCKSHRHTKCASACAGRFHFVVKSMVVGNLHVATSGQHGDGESLVPSSRERCAATSN